MAQETVQAVRKAEMNAALKEKEALQKKDTILAEAEQNAKTLITSMTKKALDTAEFNLAETNKRGNETIEAARLKAEGEVLIMKKMAERKESVAVKLVLSSVIQED